MKLHLGADLVFLDHAGFKMILVFSMNKYQTKEESSKSIDNKINK